MHANIERKPLVYSCSGCSSAAQMANAIAVSLDRRGVAEMSCIAGVGGGVAPLVAKARTAGFIVGIDGCRLHCVEACLKREGLRCSAHYDLSDHGIRKDYHRDFSAREAEALLARISEDLQRRKPRVATA